MKSFVKNAPKKDSVRQQRVARDIKNMLSEILYRDRPYDEKLGDFIVSITSVVVSASLQDAKIFVVPMVGDAYAPQIANTQDSAQEVARMQEIVSGQKIARTQEIMKYLEKNTTFFKTMLGQKLQLRFVPNIRFIFDDSYDYADHMDDVFRKLKTDKLAHETLSESDLPEKGLVNINAGLDSQDLSATNNNGISDRSESEILSKPAITEEISAIVEETNKPAITEEISAIVEEISNPAITEEISAIVEEISKPATTEDIFII